MKTLTFYRVTACVLLFLLTLAALYVGQSRVANASDCLSFYHVDGKQQIEFMQWAIGQPDFKERALAAINEYKTEACLYPNE